MSTFSSLAARATTKLASDLTREKVLASIEQDLRASMRPFRLSQELPFEHTCASPGLYYIEIKLPHTSAKQFQDFLTSWGVIRGENLPLSTPRASRKRAKQHAEKLKAKEFLPFYLGKNLKVQSRLSQHVLGEQDSKTYGLKLLCRQELFHGCELQVGFVALDVEPNAYFCVGILEAALRKRLLPIVGKQ